MRAPRCVHLLHRPEEIFAALTDPDALRTWFAEHVSIDPRIGGAYRFWGRHTIWCPDEGDADQSLVEFDPPYHLEFAWTWGGQRSRVSITIVEGAVTRLDLVHEFEGSGVGSGSAGDFWTCVLDNLRTYLQTGAPALRPDHDDDPSRAVVRLTIPIDASPDRVWSLLVEPDLLDEWIATAAVVEPVTGGRYSYGWSGGHGPSVIKRLEPGREIVTDWAYAPMQEPEATWTVGRRGDAVTMSLRHNGFAGEGDYHEHVLGWSAYLLCAKRVAERT